MPLWTYILVLGLAAGLALLLTPVGIRVALRLDLVAVPGGRRVHKGRVPRIGGLALFPAFAVAAAVTFALPVSDPLELVRLRGVLLGMGIVWVMGLLDDAYELPSWAQLVGLLAASGVAIGHKLFVELFNNPLTDVQVQVDWYLMVPITLLWLMGLATSVNFLDGLDGLVAGVTAISSLILFIHMLRLGQYSVSLLPLALLGCCLGFLPYNLTPARIFLGGGAYLLGFGLAALAIVAGAKVASALLVMWLPIVDALWLAYWRWRHGRPIYSGDRGHLHMRLQDLGWPTRRIVLVYYGFTALLGAGALLISSRLLKLGVLAAATVVVLAALIVLARRSEAQGLNQHP